MSIKFEKIKPGMILLDIHSVRAGSTTMRRKGCWPVRVISIDSDKRRAMVSWNHNPPEVWSERRLYKLYAKKPPSFIKREGGL